MNTAKQLVDILNKLIESDKELMLKVLISRYECSGELVNHIPIRLENRLFKLSLLGYLNGLLSKVDGKPALELIIDNHKNICEVKLNIDNAIDELNEEVYDKYDNLIKSISPTGYSNMMNAVFYHNLSNTEFVKNVLLEYND